MTGTAARRLSDVQRRAWHERGFLRLAGFADSGVCAAMLARVVALSRQAAEGHSIGDVFVMAESQADLGRRAHPEESVAKIFRLARDPVFFAFATRPDLLALTAELIGTTQQSCFLSQFIFKNRGAWGQPWHQDSYYFPFEPARPVVGAWLAVTAATLDNGCLHVVPGSHHEPVHAHVPDRRPNALYGYVEIVDHDMRAAEPVLMEPGDLLLFDSHLMHRSTDNRSQGIRAAMVYHYAATATVDRTEALRGHSINDWIAMPVAPLGG